MDSVQENPADRIRDFINEEMKIFDRLLNNVIASPSLSGEAVASMMAYIKGAAAASNETLNEAWPELRDGNQISLEVFEKASMANALCGVLLARASQRLALLTQGHDIISLIISVLNSSDQDADSTKAVLYRVMSEELRRRAIVREEREAI